MVNLFPGEGSDEGYDHLMWLIDLHFWCFKTIRFQIHILNF